MTEECPEGYEAYGDLSACVEVGGGRHAKRCALWGTEGGNKGLTLCRTLSCPEGYTAYGDGSACKNDDDGEDKCALRGNQGLTPPMPRCWDCPKGYTAYGDGSACKNGSARCALRGNGTMTRCETEHGGWCDGDGGCFCVLSMDDGGVRFKKKDGTCTECYCQDSFVHDQTFRFGYCPDNWKLTGDSSACVLGDYDKKYKPGPHKLQKGSSCALWGNGTMKGCNEVACPPGYIYKDGDGSACADRNDATKLCSLWGNEDLTPCADVWNTFNFPPLSKETIKKAPSWTRTTQS